MPVPALPFLAGVLGWSASEYLIHRYVGHGPRRRRPTSFLRRFSLSGLAAEFNIEHLAHHADPSYFAATSRKIAAAAVALPGLGAVLSLALGGRAAVAFTCGFGVTYAAYEFLHRRVHTHPPTGPYGRWLRRHHLLHHHRSPRANHGVTSPLWDHVAGTELPPERVRVPRHLCAPWLLDPETGEVRAAFQADYEIAGRRESAPRP